MADRSIPSEYTLKKASEHIYYEAWMLFETAAMLMQPHSQRDTNILLDAFAVHTRNLFEFLYPKEGLARKKKQPKDSDILVTDYIVKKRYYRDNRPSKKELEFVLRKANKQVSHLTYTRNRYTANNKPWPFVQITNNIHQALVTFYAALPPGSQRWPYFVQLNELLANSYLE